MLCTHSTRQNDTLDARRRSPSIDGSKLQNSTPCHALLYALCSVWRQGFLRNSRSPGAQARLARTPCVREKDQGFVGYTPWAAPHQCPRSLSLGCGGRCEVVGGGVALEKITGVRNILLVSGRVCTDFVSFSCEGARIFEHLSSSFGKEYRLRLGTCRVRRRALSVSAWAMLGCVNLD